MLIFPSVITLLSSLYMGIAGFFTGSPQHFWLIPGTFLIVIASATVVNRFLFGNSTTGVERLGYVLVGFVLIAVGVACIQSWAGWTDKPGTLQWIPTCLATGSLYGLSPSLTLSLDQ